MKTNLSTMPENTENLKSAKALYLDVSGGRHDVQERLSGLYDNLNSVLDGNGEFCPETQRPLFNLAGQEVFEAKLAELLGENMDSYQIAQFADFYSGEDSMMILRGILSHIEAVGMEVRGGGDGSMEIIIPGRDFVRISGDGKVLSCEVQAAVGADAFHYLSCYLKQDLAAVLKRDGKFMYALDISVFEKTPKDKEGRNSYLGRDIVDFHGRAPNFGPMMKNLLGKIIGAFEVGKLDMLTVDLRGSNVYPTDGSSNVSRFERDRFIPLRVADERLVGFLGVADVFFQNEDVTESPFEGGEYHEDIATQTDLLKRKCFAELGRRPLSLLLEDCDEEGKLEAVEELLDGKDLYFDEILRVAAEFNERRHGGKIDLYGISYISDKCVNDCAYCGHSTRIDHARSTLSEDEMYRDFEAVLKHSPEEFCILAGENQGSVDNCILALNVAGDVNRACGEPLQRITFNVAPMTSENFGRIVAANDTGLPLQYRIFQETYDGDVYAALHTRGPKADFDNRANAQNNALRAGFDEVGLGVLLGINDKKGGHDLDILSLIAHAYEIKKLHGNFPCSVSIPRHQPVAGYDFVTPSPVDDETYVFYHALLRLALPETKIVITSRETPEVLKRLESLINIRDLAPRPGVGGNFRSADFQNELGDSRTAEEIIKDLRLRMKR